MLKGKELLLTEKEWNDILDTHWRSGTRYDSDAWQEILKAQLSKALNLFKAEVDKLTVIDEKKRTPLTELTPDERFHCEEMATIGIIGEDEEAHQEYNRNLNSMIKWMIAFKSVEAQLQDTKKQLLDLMGE